MINKARGKKPSMAEINKRDQPEKVSIEVGHVDIEINLQKGDTEEELERNYQIKLKHQEEARKRKEEIELMEKKQRAMMMMEE